MVLKKYSITPPRTRLVLHRAAKASLRPSVALVQETSPKARSTPYTTRSRRVTTRVAQLTSPRKKQGPIVGISHSSKLVTPSPKKKKVHGSGSRRTYSFPPVWSGTLVTQSPYFSNQPSTKKVEPHTLLLGTHPSVKSLANSQYYSHPNNAFWWIAGDCLGFRRATGVSPSTGQPYAMTRHLRHTSPILPYEQQLERLVQAGFALWDIVQSCPCRKGSLDSTIRDPQANDIHGFCSAHPSIQRIVFCNGQRQLKLFDKHFSEWMASGQLVLLNQKETKDRTAAAQRPPAGSITTSWTAPHTIELVPALSVSPAAAVYTYQQKRDFWDEHVYQPGLALLPPEDDT